MGYLSNNGGVIHADVDALPMLEYDDVVRCLSDEDERSSCDDSSYSAAGIRLNRNTAHPAVLVLASWTENLRTLRLMSLTEAGLAPTPGWYTIPGDGEFGEGRLMAWTVRLSSVYNVRMCPHSLTSPKKSRFADDIGERYEKIEYGGGKLVYLLHL